MESFEMSEGAENLSTRHQREGDARRPNDTLDKGQQHGRGERAGFDPQSGAAHGSGSGAGAGGNPDEDYTTDSSSRAGAEPLRGPRSAENATTHPVDPDEGP
jgi:hypothetical protein